MTLLRYSFYFFIGTVFQFGFAQEATPWQRLEYLCNHDITLTHVVAAPKQITLIFNDKFYPMKQVGSTQDANISVRYEDKNLVWLTEESVGRLEQKDGAVLAEGCVLQAANAPAVPATSSYACKDDIVVTVRYLEEVAHLSVSDPTYGDQSYELPKATSASGAKFSNGATTWFVQGENANLFEESEEVQHAEDCKLEATMSSTKTLTGTVTYLPRIALPENAVVQVQLQDVSLQDVAAVVLAEQVIETKGQQVPILFSLSYDEATLEPNRVYALSVRIIVDGILRWINTEQVRVLGEGYPNDNVEVRVEQVQ